MATFKDTDQTPADTWLDYLSYKGVGEVAATLRRLQELHSRETGNGIAARDEVGRNLQPETQLNTWQITIFRNTAGLIGFLQ